MRVPYAIYGMILLPLLVGIIFIWKAFCFTDASCLADVFATPVFLPLVALYKMFGTLPIMNGGEMLFVFLYWALLGFLLGFFVDVLTKRDPYIPPSLYLPSQRPPL